MMGCWIVLGFVALVVVPASVLAHRADRKRTESLRVLAADLGLRFTESDLSDLESRFAEFELFGHGRHRSVTNIARGRIDLATVMLFDYTYTTGRGETRSTHDQTVAFFQSGALDLPEFVLRPAGMLDRVGQIFGYTDTELPSYAEFSRRYVLRGADEGLIRAFFTPERARFFEANPGLSVEARSDRFILYRPRERLSPDQWREWLDKGCETFGALRQA